MSLWGDCKIGTGLCVFCIIRSDRITRNYKHFTYSNDLTISRDRSSNIDSWIWASSQRSHNSLFMKNANLSVKSAVFVPVHCYTRFRQHRLMPEDGENRYNADSFVRNRGSSIHIFKTYRQVCRQVDAIIFSFLSPVASLSIKSTANNIP